VPFRIPEIYVRKTVFQLALTKPRRKKCQEIDWESRLSKNPQESDVNVFRSVWRRLKNEIKEAIIRDLQPVKDVKGGRGVGGESKPATADTGSEHGR